MALRCWQSNINPKTTSFLQVDKNAHGEEKIENIMNFESDIKNTSLPIAIDFDSQRQTLMLAFGELAHQLGMPMFEFNKITSELAGVNKIYLRDNYRIWYHRGLPTSEKYRRYSSLSSKIC